MSVNKDFITSEFCFCVYSTFYQLRLNGFQEKSHMSTTHQSVTVFNDFFHLITIEFNLILLICVGGEFSYSLKKKIRQKGVIKLSKWVPFCRQCKIKEPSKPSTWVWLVVAKREYCLTSYYQQLLSLNH